MISNSRAYQYALWCTQDESGKVGKYVQKQAKLWLDIANNKDDEYEEGEEE